MSLKFRQIDARHATIQDAHSRTCRWLLDQPEYKDWLSCDKLSKHHGFLWIRGYPGTGKSTIMKFAFESTRVTRPKDVVIRFFFNARGDEFEKTVLGMYRSLLFQLLEKIEDLQDVFALLPPKVSVDQATYVWEVQSLQILFGQAVRRLGTHSLICFIDALDECDEDQIRAMIEFFEHLGDLAASKQLRFRTCLSSRHYPHITIENGISLILDDQNGHKEDIALYVDSKLNGARSRVLMEVKQEICERSSGIFLWVVLVLQILKKDLDRGQPYVLKKRLKEIPDGLGKLFDDIITRDDRDTERFLLCLQWVLFARRPLAPLELFHALLIGMEPESLEHLEFEWLDEETLQKFVVNSSKGFAEVTKGIPPTVQFIHEAVRDYLFETNQLQKVGGPFEPNFLGSSHERLRACCQRYFEMAYPYFAESTGDLRFRRSELDAAAYSFLQYAVGNILFHADAAAAHGVDQRQLLGEFPYAEWIFLNNLIFQHPHRDYSRQETTLYIFANECLPHLTRIEARKASSIDIKGGYYGYPLHAAIARGSADVIAALLITEENYLYAEGEALHVTPDEWSAAIAKLLAYDVHPRQNDISRHKPLIILAIEKGDVHLVKVLLNVRKIKLQCELGRTALTEAARLGLADVVKLLLASGRVDVNHQTKHGRTPLSLAARGGHEGVVRLLLETGQVDIESQDVYSWTPISWAAAGGHASTMRLLYDAWRRATKKTPLDKVRLGLHRQKHHGITPLHAAVHTWESLANVMEVVKFLVSINEVDLEATDYRGDTPLGVIRRVQRQEKYGRDWQDRVEAIAKALLQAQSDRKRESAE